MSRGRVLPGLASALLLLAACAPSRPHPDARFVVGEPYSMGGVWSYPREDYGLSESGLAVVLPDAARGRRTANGEVFDPAAPVAAHRTLQLPAVLLVWNLDTGRALRVRVNDRGPAEPGRVIGLSRRAAELLGVADAGEPARVRLTVDTAASRAAAEGLPGAGGPLLAVATAPLAVVEREQLAPPPGARAAGADRAEPARLPPVLAGASVSASRPPSPAPSATLSEEVGQRPIVRSRLVVEAGVFFRRDLAQRRASALGGAVEALGSGRQPQFRVRLGPFATAAEADRAFGAALRRGIPDAKIVLD